MERTERHDVSFRADNIKLKQLEQRDQKKKKEKKEEEESDSSMSLRAKNAIFH